MISEFVADFARMIATYPDDISVEIAQDSDNHTDNNGNSITEIILYANQADIGKLIGKEGKMIGAIKTVISGCKAKDSKSYRINVEAS
jgi:predicted RNA-binding protein YlqC (UPF0109 family)